MSPLRSAFGRSWALKEEVDLCDMSASKAEQLQCEPYGKGESTPAKGSFAGEVEGEASVAKVVGPGSADGIAAGPGVGRDTVPEAKLYPQHRGRSKGPGTVPWPRLQCNEKSGSVGPQKQEGRPQRLALPSVCDQEGCGKHALPEGEAGSCKSSPSAASGSAALIDAKTANKMLVQARNSFRKQHWSGLQAEALRADQCLAAIDHDACRVESARCRDCKIAFKEEIRRYIDRESFDRFLALSRDEQLRLCPGVAPALVYREAREKARRADENPDTPVVQRQHHVQPIVERIVVPVSGIADMQQLRPEREDGPIPAPSKAISRLQNALNTLACDILDGCKPCDNSAKKLLTTSGIVAATKFVKDHAVRVARRDLKESAEIELKSQGALSYDQLRNGILQYVRSQFTEWDLFDDPRYERYLFEAAVEKGFPFESHADSLKTAPANIEISERAEDLPKSDDPIREATESENSLLTTSKSKRAPSIRFSPRKDPVRSPPQGPLLGFPTRHPRQTPSRGFSGPSPAIFPNPSEGPLLGFPTRHPRQTPSRGFSGPFPAIFPNYSFEVSCILSR